MKEYLEIRIAQLEAQVVTTPKQFVNDIMEISARLDELKRILKFLEDES